MGRDDHKDLDRRRNPEYRKDPKKEDFLKGLNEYLYPREEKEYDDHPVQAPFIFVIGAPRSGTTLMTQLVAHCFQTSYIDNLAARFFLTPLHGLRFSRSVLGEKRIPGFRSHYAATDELSNIHEFGYFWRSWLKKESFREVVRSKELEPSIDWNGLRKVLVSLQHEENRPWVFKNIFGSYHIPRFVEMLDEQVLFVHIYRDELETALSILEARRKYNSDISDWWSYIPLEYESLKDRNPYQQIAGQVRGLQRFYERELEQIPEKNGLSVNHADLMTQPVSVAGRMEEKLKSLSDTCSIKEEAPAAFDRNRKYTDNHKDRAEFEKAFEEIDSLIS